MWIPVFISLFECGGSCLCLERNPRQATSHLISCQVGLRTKDPWVPCAPHIPQVQHFLVYCQLIQEAPQQNLHTNWSFVTVVNQIRVQNSLSILIICQEAFINTTNNEFVKKKLLFIALYSTFLKNTLQCHSTALFRTLSFETLTRYSV